MGFKTTNYKSEALGITIPEAYAQIERITCNIEGRCSAIFKIQTSRNCMDKAAIDRKLISLDINKDLPIHAQVYEKAKAEQFSGWTDDIVVDDHE